MKERFRQFLAGMGSTLKIFPAEEPTLISGEAWLSEWTEFARKPIKFSVTVPSTVPPLQYDSEAKVRVWYFVPTDSESIHCDWLTAMQHLNSAAGRRVAYLSNETGRVEESQTRCP